MLLGRAAEQLRVRDLLKAARDGTSGALTLVGEPGIGKTAILEHAVAAAGHDFLVLRTRGNEAEAELPFVGLADVLRPIMPLLPDIPAAQSATLSGALGAGPQVPGDPYTAFLATYSLLSRAAEDRPVLVVVDDFHWLDQSSQAALLFAARRMAAESIALLMAVRSETPQGFSRRDGSTMVMTGLPPEDASELLRHETAGDLAPGVVARLAAETGGNPLALQELSKLLTPDQLKGVKDLPDPLPLGRHLRQLFLQRIGALPERARHALVVASASGNGDPSEIAAALVRLGLGLDDLVPAEEAEIVTMGATVQFAHPLVRAAIYHDTPPSERRGAHAALAEVVTGSDASARRAWHLAAATVGTDETVAATLETAGNEARARGAHAVAATAWLRAAELSPTPQARGPRLLAAAGEYVLAGQSARALPLLDDAHLLVPDPMMRAEIDRFRGRVLMNVGPLTDAESVLSAGASAIENAAPELAASMLSEAALTCFISGRIQIGEGYVRRAMRLTGGRDDGPGEINHILFTGTLVLSGKATEAEQHVERERRRILAMDAADEWQFIALSAIWLIWAEEYELARLVLDRAVDEARRLGGIGLLPLPLAQRAELSWRVGDGSVAYALSGEAVKLATDTGQPVTAAYAHATQTWVLAGQGRESECRTSAEAALQAAAPVGAESTVSRVEAALGLLDLGAGQYENAVRHLRNAHEMLQSQGVGEPTVVPYAGDFIECLLRAGHVSEAEDTVEYFQTHTGGGGRAWSRAILARARGMLAAEGQFEAHFAEALRLHDQLTDRFNRARTLLAFGERLRRSGQRVRAREPLREALHELERVGAASWASRTRAELRAAGGATSDVNASGLGTLTPQELQIALAVSNGLTNREVAAALFLSPKTIEFHLGNVYSKLALRSRTELVRLIAAQA